MSGVIQLLNPFPWQPLPKNSIYSIPWLAYINDIQISKLANINFMEFDYFEPGG